MSSQRKERQPAGRGVLNSQSKEFRCCLDGDEQLATSLLLLPRGGEGMEAGQGLGGRGKEPGWLH